MHRIPFDRITTLHIWGDVSINFCGFTEVSMTIVRCYRHLEAFLPFHIEYKYTTTTTTTTTVLLNIMLYLSRIGEDHTSLGTNQNSQM